MLIEEIISDREWRARELGLIKLIEKTELSVCTSSDKVQLFRNMTVPMIYAHLEGFYISALQSLADYLNKLGLSSLNVTINLLSLSLKDSYMRLQGDQGYDKRMELTNNIKKTLDNPLNIDRKLVTAKSNLNSKQIICILKDFGIPTEEYKPISTDIDKLVHFRNKIAHGENSITVSYMEYEKFIDIAIKSMDILIVLIDKYINDKQYLISQ